MSKIPSIKSSAQARLLLYRLLSQKLTALQKALLEAHPSLWEDILTEADIAKIALSDRAELERIFGYIEKATQDGLQKQFLKLTGQTLWLGVKSAPLLETFIKEHLTLIKSVQKEQLEKIGLSIQRGIREGLLQKDIAKEIHRTTELCKKRANLIARNAPLQYSGALTKHNQESAGIQKYRWQTSQDERVRSSHRAKDGKIYAWSDPGPHPRCEVNCRCDAVPVVA